MFLARTAIMLSNLPPTSELYFVSGSTRIIVRVEEAKERGKREERRECSWTHSIRTVQYAEDKHEENLMSFLKHKYTISNIKHK